MPSASCLVTKLNVNLAKFNQDQIFGTTITGVTFIGGRFGNYFAFPTQKKLGHRCIGVPKINLKRFCQSKVCEWR